MRNIRIANRDARRFVEFRTPFTGSNLFSETTSTILSPQESIYTVYSYGRHWPLLLCVTGNHREGQYHIWFGNSDKYSVTTSKHMSQCIPHGVDIVWMSRFEMRDIHTGGYVGYVKRLLTEGRRG